MEYEDQLQIADQFQSDQSMHIKQITTIQTAQNKCLKPKEQKSTPNFFPEKKYHLFQKRKIIPLPKQNKYLQEKSCVIINRQNFQSKEQKQCTFKPKINNYKNRNLNEFLEFQKGFAERKQQNLNRLKMQITKKQSEQFTGAPSIDKNSKKLMSKIEQPVFSRLSKQKQLISTQAQPSFHPKILSKSKSLARHQNVVQLLYSDARRRIQKQKITERQTFQKIQYTPKINENTDKLVLKRIKQDFDESTSKNIDVAPIVGLSIISQIFNTDLNPKKDAHTSLLCQKILKYVVTNNKISVKKLWKFIQHILGIFSDENKEFTQKQYEEIHKNFGFFYRNRMTKEKRVVEKQTLKFQPEILKNSEKLACKKRQKMMKQANQMLEKHNIKLACQDSKQIPLTDLYTLKKLHKQQENRRKKLENQQKQLAKCTFKPEILRKSIQKNSSVRLIKKTNCNSKFKVKNQLKNQNVTQTLNTQYSCDSKQKNTIRKTSVSKDKSLSKDHQSKIHEIKDMQKTCLRLSAARKDRQYQNLLKQRGYPKDIENWENYRVNEKKSIQKNLHQLKGYMKNSGQKKGFIFDVNVGNGVKQTIFIRRDQPIENIVNNLTQKYNFDQKKIAKLKYLISYHLKNHQKIQKQNLLSN